MFFYALNVIRRKKKDVGNKTLCAEFGRIIYITAPITV